MNTMVSCLRQLTPPSEPEPSPSKKPVVAKRLLVSPRSRKLPPLLAYEPVITPPRSPVRSTGPFLLPKIRLQDQHLSPSPVPSLQPIQPIISNENISPQGYSLRAARHEVSYPSYLVSPGGRAVRSPDSAVYRSRQPLTRGPLQPMPAIVNYQPVSLPPIYTLPSIQTHGSVRKDPAANSLYRQKLPRYPSESINLVRANSGVSTSLKHPPSIPPAPLTPSLLFESYREEPVSITLLEYLTAPNPICSLIRHLPTLRHLTDTHFWWDIRNIRSWTDFNLSTIHSIPGLTSLLTLPLPSPALPPLARTNTNPETLSALQEIYTSTYIGKINAALKVALGQPLLTLLPIAPNPHAPTSTPHFLLNYTADHASPPIFGARRARAVGLLRPYDTWNTGMRSPHASAAARTAYLRELAALHAAMRAHGCRYGFLMSEIELVCVRAGTEEEVPYFGFLELAEAVQLKEHGCEAGMTAGVALWYLCMLAKRESLPGQYGWRIEIGGPAAGSRRKFLERDTGMLKPEGREKREAKRRRGWVLPEEPLSRKECGRIKARRVEAV